MADGHVLTSDGRRKKHNGHRSGMDAACKPIRSLTNIEKLFACTSSDTVVTHPQIGPHPLLMHSTTLPFLVKV